MSSTAIFTIGLGVVGLCAAFVIVSVSEMRRLGREWEERDARERQLERGRP